MHGLSALRRRRGRRLSRNRSDALDWTIEIAWVKNMGWDAIIVGAGLNGLAAAVHLCSKGWKVLVLERAETPGGAVKSPESATTARANHTDVRTEPMPLVYDPIGCEAPPSPRTLGIRDDTNGLSHRISGVEDRGASGRKDVL